jgi:hypothetical protein
MEFHNLEWLLTNTDDIVICLNHLVRRAEGGRCILTDLHFFNLFSLDGKLFATLKFSGENFFERKLPLLSSFCLIRFFSDRLFLLYKLSFEKTLKQRALAIEGV